MGDHLKKVQTGDALKIPAQTFNAFIDAALDHKRRQQSTQRTLLPGAGGKPVVVIHVRNDTGQDLERFSAVGISAPLIGPSDNADEFKGRAMAAGVLPIVPDHRGRFAVYLEPVAYGAVGAACVSGVIPCQINVDDETHLRADVEHEQTQLLTGHHGGAEILWKESGTGTKWALLRIGIVEPLAITFDVRLEQVEGDAGVNGESDCTFKYDVFDIHTDEKLNEDEPLELAETNIRPPMTQMVPATRGTAYWTVEENKIVVALEEAFETPTPRAEQYVVTAITCGPGEPGSGSGSGSSSGSGDSGGGTSGGEGAGGGGCQITYYTTRVRYPAGTRLEPGPAFTINCGCCCGSGESGG